MLWKPDAIELSSVQFASEASMKVGARLLELLFDQTPDIAFFIKDCLGRYVVVSQSLVERNGLHGKSELIGKRIRDLCPGELGRAHSDQDAEVIRSGEPIIGRLEHHWHLPNRPCWCLTTKLPLRREDGEISGLVGISQDIRAPMVLKDIPNGLAHALRTLESGFGGDVSPASLAKAAGLGNARFARVVKRVFGLTPTQLILKTRVEAASLMLRNSNRTVAEIALACGFYDHSAFTRVFRTATGVVPSRFREASR